VICPHLNTAFMGRGDDRQWLDGDLEILRRCDAIYMLNGWRDSAGALAELDEAHRGHLTVYYEWLMTNNLSMSPE